MLKMNTFTQKSQKTEWTLQVLETNIHQLETKVEYWRTMWGTSKYESVYIGTSHQERKHLTYKWCK